MKKIFALLFVLLSTACSNKTEHRDLLGQTSAVRNAVHDSGEGRLYIDALVDAIQKSDRIVVTEHSNANDVLDALTQPQPPIDYQPIIFTTHELDSHERTNFLVAMKDMAAKTQDAEPACIFEPHHTITFYRANKQLSALRVCFQCGQVEWDGSAKMRPSALVGTLGTLMAGWGMKEERDWRALAKNGAK